MMCLELKALYMYVVAVILIRLCEIIKIKPLCFSITMSGLCRKIYNKQLFVFVSVDKTTALTKTLPSRFYYLKYRKYYRISESDYVSSGCVTNMQLFSPIF